MTWTILCYIITTKDSSNEQLIFIPDEFSENEPYTIKPISGLGEINSSVVLPDYLFVVKSTSGKASNVDPSGKISLQGNQSDYYLGVTFNNGCNLPLYTIRTNGNDETNSSLEVIEDGMVLTSDNLNNVTTTANNKYSVLIKTGITFPLATLGIAALLSASIAIITSIIKRKKNNNP